MWNLSSVLFSLLPAFSPQEPARPPGAQGQLAMTGSYVTEEGQTPKWTKPPFAYDAKVATGRKVAKVAVVIYDPKLPSGETLTQHVKGADPVQYSHILIDVIGKLRGVTSTTRSSIGSRSMVSRRRSTASGTRRELPRGAREERMAGGDVELRWGAAQGEVDRIAKEGITEVWLWGASGMHFDEFAGWLKGRYQRFAPTDNPWFYRPYDIPGEQLGRTFWVMGFNYEVGADNMIHSYSHRVESQCALAFADGVWSPKTQRDPWNVFSLLEVDIPGSPSMVGNCHVPPNGKEGYDYGNQRKVLSWADRWSRYPDLRGQPREVSRETGATRSLATRSGSSSTCRRGLGTRSTGTTNWWVYIANVDGDLPDWTPPQGPFRLPEGMPAIEKAK